MDIKPLRYFMAIAKTESFTKAAQQLGVAQPAVSMAIKKLETSNQGLKVILDNLDEQLKAIRADPKLAGMVDDLETLFYAYLKTWMKSNNEIIDVLKEK